MPNYNFLNLSPPEFEELTRDLLQKELDITLESFTDGRDNGIDLRHSAAKDSLIVQCKRYENFNSLLNNLKKEVTKLKKLAPKRYILSTSVGLTPLNKSKIVSLLTPYIKTTADVFGKDDLNNLLGKFQEIETQHYKLWLSSTNVLDKILNSRVHNQSSFEEEIIKDVIKTYVENESFSQAINILKENNFVIISGIPGIGKSTLARVLVYYFLANGFDEFIFLSESINDGYTSYKEEKSQVYLYDDFLGTNFLTNSLTTNEEQRIAKFIEKIKKSKNKILIFTTREYILQQAKQKYEVFEDISLEIAKCVIDLSQYTKIIRAKILYNHLFFSDLPEAYKRNILEKESYLWIIEHANFNPRLINLITTKKIWSKISPEEYSDRIEVYLDNPEEIWKHTYEHQISTFSKCLLANLLSNGTPILREDLIRLLKRFSETHSQKYHINFNEIDFNNALKELENTFIKIEKDDFNNFRISYQNPSVQDFLTNYFVGLEDFINDILVTAIYYNQFLSVFSLNHEETSEIYERIPLKRVALDTWIDRITNDFELLEVSSLHQVLHGLQESSEWRRNRYSQYSKLYGIISGGFDQNPLIKAFIIEKFQSLMNPETLYNDDFGTYLQILKHLKNEYEFDQVTLISQLSQVTQSESDVATFALLEEIFPQSYNIFVKSNDHFADEVLRRFENQLDYVDIDYIEDFNNDFQVAIKHVIALNGIEKYENRLEFLHSSVSNILEEKEVRDEFEYENWKENRDFELIQETENDETIREIFNSLIGEEH